MTTWNELFEALETWPGGSLTTWQKEEWAKAFRDDGPTVPLDALREIYGEQPSGKRHRPSIREVRKQINPNGPDAQPNYHKDELHNEGPRLERGELRPLIDKLTAQWSFDEDDDRSSRDRQRRSLERAQKHYDFMRRTKSREEILREAYEERGLDYDASQEAGKPKRKKP